MTTFMDRAEALWRARLPSPLREAMLGAIARWRASGDLRAYDQECGFAIAEDVYRRGFARRGEDGRLEPGSGSWSFDVRPFPGGAALLYAQEQRSRQLDRSAGRKRMPLTSDAQAGRAAYERWAVLVEGDAEELVGALRDSAGRPDLEARGAALLREWVHAYDRRLTNGTPPWLRPLPGDPSMSALERARRELERHPTRKSDGAGELPF